LSSRTITFLISCGLAALNLLGLVKLSPKYYFDSDTIQLIASGIISDNRDKSFGAIASTIRALHLIDYPAQSKFLILCIFLFLTQSFIARKSISTNFAITIFVLSSLFFIGSIYFHMYTKEIIPLFLNSLILLASLKIKREQFTRLTLVLLVLIYAYLVRSYWFLTIAIFLYLTIIDKSKFSISGKIRANAIVFTFAVYAIYRFNPGQLASIQQDLNQNRLNSEFANSALSNYPDFLPLILYWPYRILSLFMPFILVQKMNLQSFLFSVFFLAANYLIWKRYKEFGSREWDFKILYFFFLSHVITLSLFEPDYGSFVKHITPFFVIIAFLVTKQEKLNNQT